MPPLKTPPAGRGGRSSVHLASYLANIIGIPLADWPGNCYMIVRKIADSGWIPGVARYGHWRGGATPDSLFAYAQHAPFVQHGWMLLDGNSVLLRGRTTEDLMDPTRWTFESSDPRHAYIYLGWENEPEYDPGGNAWRQANERPCPEPRHTAKAVSLDLDDTTRGIVNSMLGEPAQLVTDHVFWLANLSLTTLGPIAKPLYEAIDASGLRAAIPLDNWTMVMVQETYDPLGATL